MPRKNNHHSACIKNNHHLACMRMKVIVLGLSVSLLSTAVPVYSHWNAPTSVSMSRQYFSVSSYTGCLQPPQAPPCLQPCLCVCHTIYSNHYSVVECCFVCIDLNNYVVDCNGNIKIIRYFQGPGASACVTVKGTVCTPYTFHKSFHL